MKEFTQVENKREITRDVYEHEVLLAFRDDAGAYAFNEWWYNEGSKVFNEWLKQSKYYNHIAE